MGCGDKSQKQSWHNDPGLVSPIPDPKLDNCRVCITWMTPVGTQFSMTIFMFPYGPGFLNKGPRSWSWRLPKVGEI